MFKYVQLINKHLNKRFNCNDYNVKLTLSINCLIAETFSSKVLTIGVDDYVNALELK